MKFNLAQPILLDGLRQVANIVSTKVTLPVLSNVLLTASKEDGTLRFTSTDLDVAITCTVPAMVEESGSITLPAKKLHSIVSELPAADVSVVVDDKHTATIKCERSTFRLLGLGATDFPDFPVITGTHSFKVPQAMLKEGIKRTSFAIAPDDARFTLTGMFFSFKDGKMTQVATDGRRLAMSQQELEFPESQQRDAIIPLKPINELARLLSDKGDIIIKLSENQVSFEFDDSVMISKLIEGNYPNYKQVIPSDHKERILLPRAEFLEIIRRISLLSATKVNSVKLTFADGELRADAAASNLGDAHEPFPIDYAGRQMTISFNPDFLMAPLKAIDADTIAFDLVDEMSPGVIRMGDEFAYVIMPMRVSQ